MLQGNCDQQCVFHYASFSSEPSSDHTEAVAFSPSWLKHMLFLNYCKMQFCRLIVVRWMETINCTNQWSWWQTLTSSLVHLLLWDEFVTTKKWKWVFLQEKSSINSLLEQKLWINIVSSIQITLSHSVKSYTIIVFWHICILLYHFAPFIVPVSTALIVRVVLSHTFFSLHYFLLFFFIILPLPLFIY